MRDIWDVDKDLVDRARALIIASKFGVQPVHGRRSPEQAQRLWAEAEKRYGAQADQHIARPGHSNHERGVAMDIMFESDEAYEWVQKNIHRYGLEAPMPWEPWHIEPIGLARGEYKPEEYVQERNAYTWQKNEPHPADRDLGAPTASMFRSILSKPISERPTTEAAPPPTPAATAPPPMPEQEVIPHAEPGSN